MANIISFGKIRPVTPATPIGVTEDASIFVHELVFCQPKAQTGSVYVGIPGMNKTSYGGTIKEFFPAAESGLTDKFAICGGESNRIHPKDYRVDADVDGEGVFVYGIQV